jgi:hypothetical protein
MHPLIARFLDFSAAVDALEKPARGQPLDADEAALVAAAAAAPKSRKAVLEAKGSKQPSPTAQQHLIVLATRAATARLADDAELSAKLGAARAALLEQGAGAEEAEGLLAQAVLEESFGYDEDPDTFDAAFLAETLDGIRAMAAMTQDTVDEWLEAFARAGAAGERALRLKVAELVLEAAWGEGPQPITPEHIDEALEQLAEAVAGSEFPRAVALVTELLSALAQRGVIGPTRLARLAHVAQSAAAAGPDEGQGDEEPDEDE